MKAPELQPQTTEHPTNWDYENWPNAQVSSQNFEPLESAEEVQKRWGLPDSKLMAAVKLPTNASYLDKTSRSFASIPEQFQEGFMNAEDPKRTAERRAGRTLMVFEHDNADNSGVPTFYVGSAEAFNDVRLGRVELDKNPAIKKLGEGEVLQVGREGWLPDQAREEEERSGPGHKRVISRQQAVFEVKDGQLNLFGTGKNKIEVEFGRRKGLGQMLAEATQSRDNLETHQLPHENRVVGIVPKPPLAKRKSGEALDKAKEAAAEADFNQAVKGDWEKTANYIEHYANATGERREAIDNIHRNIAVAEAAKAAPKMISEAEEYLEGRQKLLDPQAQEMNQWLNMESPSEEEIGSNVGPKRLGRAALLQEFNNENPDEPIFNQLSSILGHDPTDPKNWRKY